MRGGYPSQHCSVNYSNHHNLCFQYRSRQDRHRPKMSPYPCKVQIVLYPYYKTCMTLVHSKNFRIATSEIGPSHILWSRLPCWPRHIESISLASNYGSTSLHRAIHMSANQAVQSSRAEEQSSVLPVFRIFVSAHRHDRNPHIPTRDIFLSRLYLLQYHQFENCHLAFDFLRSQWKTGPLFHWSFHQKTDCIRHENACDYLSNTATLLYEAE